MPAVLFPAASPLAAAALAVCVTLAPDEAPGPKTPTVEEFFKVFVDTWKAVEKEDRTLKVVEGILPLVAERSKPMARSMADLCAAEEELAAALDRRFGKAREGQLVPGRVERGPDAQRLVKAEVIGKRQFGPDRVILTVLITNAAAEGAGERVESLQELHVILVREGGNWRMLLPSPFDKGNTTRIELRKTAEGKEVRVQVAEGDDRESDDEELAEAKGVFDWTAGGVRRLARDVAGGQVASRDEAIEFYVATTGKMFNPVARRLARPADWPREFLRTMRGRPFRTDEKPR
jgi:hypothetical protein